MSDIFAKLGFDPGELEQALAEIRAQFDADQSIRNKTVRERENEIAALNNAVAVMTQALDGMDPLLESFIRTTDLNARRPFSLTQVRQGIAAIREAVSEIHIKEGRGRSAKTRSHSDFPGPTAGPVSFGVYVGRNTNPARDHLIIQLAALYKRQTGKEPTFTVEPYNQSRVSGDFPEFLRAAAERIGVPTRGLVSQGRHLRQERRI